MQSLRLQHQRLLRAAFSRYFRCTSRSSRHLERQAKLLLKMDWIAWPQLLRHRVLATARSFSWSIRLASVMVNHSLVSARLQLIQTRSNKTGNYTPPKCNFNRVTMNFTVTSRGRQFDRLALMYFGDTEVWRTSTAEPTANGIRWEYIKDMSEYLYFWNSSQTIIFDLGNLIDNTYTGAFNTTLTATFSTSNDTVEPASVIIPISARKGAANAASVFSLPAENATNTIGFPRNANRAVFSVSACGQATEEFWWSNVLQSDINTFVPVAGTLYGYSPFREVQVLIDGQIAGVYWPFPVIFTGGVVPGKLSRLQSLSTLA